MDKRLLTILLFGVACVIFTLLALTVIDEKTAEWLTGGLALMAGGEVVSRL